MIVLSTFMVRRCSPTTDEGLYVNAGAVGRAEYLPVQLAILERSRNHLAKLINRNDDVLVDPKRIHLCTAGTTKELAKFTPTERA